MVTGDDNTATTPEGGEGIRSLWGVILRALVTV